jgi:hypothetical protein
MGLRYGMGILVGRERVTSGRYRGIRPNRGTAR